MESQICWQLSVRLVFASARCRAFVCCSGLFIRFFQLRADVWLGNSICAGWSQNGSGWYHFIGSFCGLSVNAFLLCLSGMLV